MKNSHLIPDASKHAPATAVTPQMIADAAQRVMDMNKAGADPRDIAEAVRAHGELVEAQTRQLQDMAMREEVRRMAR